MTARFLLQKALYRILKAANMRSPAPPAWFNFAAQVNEEGKTFKGETVLLDDDIDLNNEPWTPIGQTGSTEFKGVFDGQGYTIKNLYIDSTAETGAHYSSGLFGWLENHGDGIVIKNVNVDGATVKGNHNCAVIAGYVYGTIENCHVTDAEIVCTHANEDACGDCTGANVNEALIGRVMD